MKKNNKIKTNISTKANKQVNNMKLIKLISLTSLLMTSAVSYAGMIDSSQMMPPPGPYQSMMNNAASNSQAPASQNKMPQVYQHNSANNQYMARQTPDWAIKQQQMAKENYEKMNKKNAERYRDNENQYAEYLKKSEKLAAQREENRKKWIEQNNKQMMQAWKNMLDQYTKNQQQQIQAAKNMPEWMKERMLKQHEQQLAMMNDNPPMQMPVQPRMQAMPNYSQQPMMQPMNPMQMNNMGPMNPMPMNSMGPMNNMGMGRVPMQQMPQGYSAPYNNFHR